MAEVRIEGLTKRFPGGVQAVDDLDLDIEDGEFFSLLGPSGCGKTTLLRSIAGLETPTAGRISIGEQDVTRIPPGERDVAMVFQDYALYPHMEVVDNIAYPLKVRKHSKSDRHRRAGEAAESLSLGELLNRRPAALSGGQQQRVAVARAVAHEPSVFLFDEPLSNLDARLRLEARTFLKRLQGDLGVSTVYVTHDQSEALALSDRMAVMKDGRIRQIGAPEEVFSRPTDLFVASFIGSVPMNLLASTTTADGGLELAGQRVPVPGPYEGMLEPNRSVTFGARPEHGSLTPPDTPGAMTGLAVVAELLGTEHLVTVECGDVMVRVVTSDPPTPGEPVGVRFEEAWVLLFDTEDEQLIRREPAAAGDVRSTG